MAAQCASEVGAIAQRCMMVDFLKDVDRATQESVGCWILIHVRESGQEGGRKQAGKPYAFGRNEFADSVPFEREFLDDSSAQLGTVNIQSGIHQDLRCINVGIRLHH